MDAPAWNIKKQVCEIGRRIWQRGYCAGNEGNHSVRIGPDRILCTPTGMSKGFMEPDDLCVIDMDGKQAQKNDRGRTPTSEVLVHLAIYRKLENVGAVIHSHPPHAVAFCLANIPLPEGIHPEAEIFLGKTVFAKYATTGSPAVPESFIHQLTPNTNTVLLANHGSVSIGRDLTEAYDRLEVLDSYCKQLLLTRQLGRINVLDGAQIAELLKVKERFGLSDDRAASAQPGGIVAQNNPYLAGFSSGPENGQAPPGPDAIRPGVDATDRQFERLVRAIADRVIDALRG